MILSGLVLFKILPLPSFTSGGSNFFFTRWIASLLHSRSLPARLALGMAVGLSSLHALLGDDRESGHRGHAASWVFDHRELRFRDRSGLVSYRPSGLPPLPSGEVLGRTGGGGGGHRHGLHPRLQRGQNTLREFAGVKDPTPFVPPADPGCQESGCSLCGLPLGNSRFRKTIGGEVLRFCCPGCEQVFSLLSVSPGGIPRNFRETEIYRACVQSGIILPGAPFSLPRPSSAEGTAESGIPPLPLTLRVGGMLVPRVFLADRRSPPQNAGNPGPPGFLFLRPGRAEVPAPSAFAGGGCGEDCQAGIPSIPPARGKTFPGRKKTCWVRLGSPPSSPSTS